MAEPVAVGVPPHPFGLSLWQSGYCAHPFGLSLWQSGYCPHPFGLSLSQSGCRAHPFGLSLWQSGYCPHPFGLSLSKPGLIRWFERRAFAKGAGRDSPRRAWHLFFASSKTSTQNKVHPQSAWV